MPPIKWSQPHFICLELRVTHSSVEAKRREASIWKSLRNARTFRLRLEYRKTTYTLPFSATTVKQAISHLTQTLHKRELIYCEKTTTEGTCP